MFERFTEDARAAVTGAQRHAEALGHGYIGTEHLLLALFDDAERRAARLLRSWGLTAEWVGGEVERIVGRAEPGIDPDALATLGIDLDAVRERVERTFGRGALARPAGRRCPSPGRLPFTPRSKKALELSLREAIALHDDAIGTEHVLLGLAGSGGAAEAILRSRGVDRAAVRAALERDAAR
jgi:ATP-dependent Clp protease ATP-binding subunit ClpA